MLISKWVWYCGMIIIFEGTDSSGIFASSVIKIEKLHFFS